MILNSVFWAFSEKFGCQAVSFIVSIIIARLISPSAYGVVAIVNAFIQIFTVFADTGFGSYIQQNKMSDELDYSTCLISNVVMCTILYLILFAISPLIASFYGDLDLTLLLRVSGIAILISSVKNIQQSHINRNMLFKNYFLSSLAGTIGAGIIGIYMAVKGFGVWALIVSNLFDMAVDTAVMCFTVKLKISLNFSFTKFKKIFSYSWKLIITYFIERVYNKIFNLVIGKVYDTSSLAYYEKGKSLTEKIPENTENVIDSVIFPVMVNNKDDNEKLVSVTKKFLQVCTYVMYPMLIGIFIVSDNLVEVLLTDKWIAVVPYIRIMCIVEMISPLVKTNINVITAKGRSDIVLRNEIIKKIINIVFLIITIPLGVLTMVSSKIILNLIFYIIESKKCKEIIGYGSLSQIADLKQNILGCFLMSVAVCALSLITLDNLLILLLLKIVAGVLAYLLYSYLTKNESFIYLRDILINLIKRINPIKNN